MSKKESNPPPPKGVVNPPPPLPPPPKGIEIYNEKQKFKKNKMSKFKTKQKTVKTAWVPVQEWELIFQCPYCCLRMQDCEIDIKEGEKYNSPCKCPKCKKIFTLKVDC